MKINELLKLPVGSPVSGVMRIKTAKKTWEVKAGSRNVWMHLVCLNDETGDILADVKIGVYKPLQRGTEINIIAGQIQQGENGVKLYVAEFTTPSDMGEPVLPDGYGDDSLAIIESKVRCLLISGYLNGSEVDTSNEAEYARFRHNINRLVSFVMNGE